MIEERQTSPHFDMHILEQVAPKIQVGLIARAEPAKQRPMQTARFLV